MINFRLYDNELDIDLDEWSKKEYSVYYNDVHKFALFNENISQLYKSYVDNPNSMDSIFDKIIVAEEGKEKINKKVLGINPILVNPKYINMGYGRKIIQHLIDFKGRLFNMLPDRFYAGIDSSNTRCKHLFESLNFKLYGKSDDNEFLYYELEL